MGILANAISDILDKGISFGLDEFGSFLQRGRQKGILQKQVQAAEQRDLEEVLQQQALTTLLSGQESLPGVSSLLGGGQATVDSNDPIIQERMTRLRQAPPINPALLQGSQLPIQEAFARRQQSLNIDPFIAQQKEIQRQQGKAFDTTAGVVGKQGELGNLGINEISGQVLNPTLTLDEGRQRSRDTVRGISQARAEGRNVVTQRNKRTQGSNQGKKEKPTRLKDFEMKRIKDEFLANPDFSEKDIQNSGKRKLTGKGNKAFRLAVKKAEEGLSPLDAVSEVESNLGKNKALAQRAKKQAGGNPIEAVRRIAPGSPRHKEIEQEINDAKAKGLSNGKIKALLRKDGIDPAFFGL